MILDLFILLAIVFGFLQGYKRGVINSIFFLLAFFLGSIIALRFGYLVALLINKWFGVESEYLPLISIAVLFIAVIIVILILAKSLEGILKAVQLNFFNRIVGGVLWAVAGVYLVSLAFWYLEKYEVVTEEAKETSVAYPYLGHLSQQMTEGLGRALPFVLDTYYDVDRMLEEFQQEHVPEEPQPAS